MVLPGRSYHAIIDNIRRHMPDASISGDAIVGFPGESEEQYAATERLVREVGRGVCARVRLCAGLIWVWTWPRVLCCGVLGVL